MKAVLSVDALTLHAVTDELRSRVLGARVQKIGLLGPRGLGLDLYRRGERLHVLISAESEAARVCLTRERLARGSEAVTPLLLLLRKYVRDGLVEDLTQPPLERVLELRVSKRDDGGDLREVVLIIEVMGRRSNAVLVSGDGTILDALRRAAPARNPARPILPHLRYAPPPPQSRLDPWATDTWDRLPELAAGQPEAGTARHAPTARLDELLSGQLRGFSPLLGKEAAFRCSGGVDAPASGAHWSDVRAAVMELLGPVRHAARWSPSVARHEGRVVAFAPYHLHHLEPACEVADVDSISEAIELAFAAAPRPTASRQANNQLARALLDAIATRRALVERRQAALARAADATGDPDELREAGQLVLAAASSIQPGQQAVEIAGRAIPLDPRQSPVANAQRYFREYRKAREATKRIPELLKRASMELAYLDDTQTLAELADDPASLRALREELRSSGVLADTPSARGPSGRGREAGPRPLRVALSEGFVALIGTSARGNERVTFDLAGQSDVWLHARALPGAHVVVRTGGRELPGRVLLQAARLAAHYSRGRGAGRVVVDWTLRKHVRKIRGGPPGLVSYVNEQTVRVVPGVVSSE